MVFAYDKVKVQDGTILNDPSLDNDISRFRMSLRCFNKLIMRFFTFNSEVQKICFIKLVIFLTLNIQFLMVSNYCLEVYQCIIYKDI